MALRNGPSHTGTISWSAGEVHKRKKKQNHESSIRNHTARTNRPRLRAVIPKAVKTVGAEDAEELLQDAMTIAAQMLHRVEETGKKVTPGNIAYYVILHMKSGRRSQSATRTDVMAPGTQLDDKSCVLSFGRRSATTPNSMNPSRSANCWRRNTKIRHKRERATSTGSCSCPRTTTATA